MECVPYDDQCSARRHCDASGLGLACETNGTADLDEPCSTTMRCARGGLCPPGVDDAVCKQACDPTGMVGRCTNPAHRCRELTVTLPGGREFRLGYGVCGP